ncbi:MAG TPA: hypothetical protein VGG38_07345 [Acidimicrobiales bacterium]|jgi:hypothetical protein
MPVDLATQIRDLIDGPTTVSADEAMTRGVAVSFSEHSRRRHLAPVVAVAAGVVTVAAVGVVVTRGTGDPASPGVVTPSHMILTAAKVHAIAASSAAASGSSGTAQVSERTLQNGSAQSDNEVAVTFDGANIDEKITVYPEPVGSDKVFTTDDRLVDGAFYIYTPGPNDVLEWMHDTSNDNADSMQFPDPRTLYGALSPDADFEAVGTSSVNGVTITRLEAIHPEAISASTLGNLAAGTLASFEMSIDPNDVVQQMSFSSSQTMKVCVYELPGANGAVKRINVYGAGKLSTSVLDKNKDAAGVQVQCSPQTTTTESNVAYSNLGLPQSVPVPQGAVDFQGKG